MRVLEAERAELARENDRLRGAVGDERSQRLAAEARAEAKEAELRAAMATTRSSDPAVAGGSTDDFASRLRRDGIDATRRDDGSTAVTLASDVTFPSGKADLNPLAEKVLRRVASEILSTRNILALRVEGHTDSDPIRKSGWPSNRELSQARAESVRKYLVAQGVPESLLTTLGHGESQPLVTNDSKANKAKNRRVEIILVPAASR
ncbi:MAG: OmpA/MotB family protein [Planctomycetaceae bacterium]